MRSPWPPASPDPSAILHEAVDDARNGHYALALTKHNWYHDNALKHQPSQYGVRLSFALRYWHELASKYPPAMNKLHALRETAANNAIAGIETHESFHDAYALDRVIGDSNASRDLFHQLHENNPSSAKTVYHIAQPVLVAFGDYDICNQHLDPDTAVDRIIELFQFHQNRPSPETDSRFHREFAENNFRNESATVIALLAVSDELDMAQNLANRILEQWDHKSVRDIIDRALNGEFPPQREHERQGA